MWAMNASLPAAVADRLAALAGCLDPLPELAAAGQVTVVVEPGTQGYTGSFTTDDGDYADMVDLDLDLLDELAAALADAGHPRAVLELRRTFEPRWHAVLCTCPEISGDAEIRRRIRSAPLGLTEPQVLPPLLDDDRHAIDTAWQRAASAYEPSGPAREADLSALASALGVPVPPPLAALLACTDGVTPKPRSRKRLLGSWRLMSCAQIAESHAHWVRLADRGIYDGPALGGGSPGAMQPRLLHPGWIPFAADDAGNHLAVDLVPGPAGRAGQVIEFGRDLDRGPVLYAESLVDALAGRTVEVEQPGEEVFRDAPVEVADPRTESVRIFDTTFPATVWGHVPQLRTLLVRGSDIDFTGAAQVPLQEVRMLYMEAIDLRPLAGHPTLRRLSIEGMEPGEITGLDVIAELLALENLEIDAAYARQVVPDLAAHPRLCDVTLRGGERLDEVLEILAALDHEHCRLVDSVHALSGDFAAQA